MEWLNNLFTYNEARGLQVLRNLEGIDLIDDRLYGAEKKGSNASNIPIQYKGRPLSNLIEQTICVRYWLSDDGRNLCERIAQYENVMIQEDFRNFVTRLDEGRIGFVLDMLYKLLYRAQGKDTCKAMEEEVTQYQQQYKRVFYLRDDNNE